MSKLRKAIGIGLAVVGVANIATYADRTQTLSGMFANWGQNTTCFHATTNPEINPIWKYTVLFGMEKANNDFIYANCEGMKRNPRNFGNTNFWEVYR